MADTDLSRILHDTKAAGAPELVERCVDLKMAGWTQWTAVCRRIQRQDPAVPDEAVKACLESEAFRKAFAEARQDREGYLQRRLRRDTTIHQTLDEVEYLASEQNGDKRTRTANAHFRLGVAGITPQTQVAIGPNEDFVALVERALTKRAD